MAREARSCEICKKTLRTGYHCTVMVDHIQLKGAGKFDVYGSPRFFCSACLEKVPVLK